MPGVKTNERPGTRAVLRHFRMSASKARQVLDLIRGEEVQLASEILATVEREAGEVIGKVLASAVANAVHNDRLDAEDLYVSACYADEGATMKRWRPRARGRATRIRKRTCHITVIVSPLPEERLARRRAERAAAGGQRSRRVAESRRRADLAGRLSRRRVAAEQAADEAAAEEAAAAEAEAIEAEAAVAENAELAETETPETETPETETPETETPETVTAETEQTDVTSEADADEEEKGK